jgi:DNA invertase Pin-like site-specific DNA recombinase
MRRAAQYLRMSTEHQQYSLDNQASAISIYASQKACEVVKTYIDAAKSGLTLRKRDGLKQLLEDVVAGNCWFEVILVYDVSRWGRFQDADEAAHYEFLCKSSGIPIEYCAETFSNETGITASLMKALKRSMAGEYSRELSVKVKQAHERLAKLGYKQGGMPGYGLRRMLIPSDTSRPTRLLLPGERKGLTDHVILVPGPGDEVLVIKDIFRLFVIERLSLKAIARELNRKGLSFVAGSKWDHMHVRRILTGHKYVGCHVYGKSTQALFTPTKRVPKEQWVVAPNAFSPLIDMDLFDKAQQRIASFTCNKTDEQVLEDVRRLWKTEGRLSREVIENCRWVSPSTIAKRFGGLLRLYAALGYDHREKYYDRDLRQLILSAREQFYRDVCRIFGDKVAVVARGGNWAPILKLVKPNLELSVAIARHFKTVSGGTRWVLSPNKHEQHLVKILVRLAKGNKRIHDVRIFEEFPSVRTMMIRPRDPRLKAGVKLRKLSDLLDVLVPIAQSRRFDCSAH